MVTCDDQEQGILIESRKNKIGQLSTISLVLYSDLREKRSKTHVNVKTEGFWCNILLMPKVTLDKRVMEIMIESRNIISYIFYF